jgi:uncharacterized protein YegL
MKTRIFNLVILDESGSMQSIKREAISGVNETIQTIRSAQNKYEDQEHLFTMVSFNSDAVKVIFDSVNIGQVLELKPEQYNPNCATPLYDAMGIALNKLRKQVEMEDKVLVTVITDGEENSSKEYSGKAIKALVDELKALGWVFTYIGANQDVESVAASISITNVMNFQTTSEGTHAMFAQERKSRSRWFDKISEGCQNLADDFFEDEKK